MLTRYKALQIGLILVGDVCLVQQSMALGLGELKIESALTEPLDASIELLDVGSLDPAQISVSLGTEEDFTSAGAELLEMASQVQFEVEIDGATNRIQLTTLDDFEEPYLDLILNVSWPDGTLQRQYTILLNLPGTVSTADDSFVIPTVTNPAFPVAAGAEPPSQEAESLPDANDPDPVGNGQEYTVENGDAMWEIAARTRPNSDVGMQQMMVAIQRANEDAFINNNINRVRAGKVLRIPTLQEINLLDQDAAVTQISQQNQQLAVQPLAVNRTAASNTPAPAQDELTVLTDDQSNAGAAGDTDLEATLAALENDMMMSEESLDRARLENAELTGRFKMLEEELDLLQNIIDVEETRIAQLQAGLATQAETAEQALASTEEATSVLAAQQPEPQPGIIGNVSNWLQNTVVLLGVVVGLFLLILGYLFWQRRRMTAAVYAFDSGIPELETAGNSSFAPAAKSGGGLMGWISGLGSKKADNSAEAALTSDAGRTGASAVFSRNTTAVQSDEFNDAELDGTENKLQHSDNVHMIDTAALDRADMNPGSDEFARSSFQNDDLTASSWQGGSASQTTRTVGTEVDDAELADALIAEARDMDNSPAGTVDDAVASIHHETEVELRDAQREAEALTALMTPDVATTEAGIPESFEFTLTTVPEALAEETSLETDDIESFDFQLSDSAAPSAEPEMSDEELQLSSLLLDEEDGDLQNIAPMDECDTKLDLAVAYEAMGDIDGANEILGEVLADGNSTQIAEARRLKGLWQSS